MVAYPPLWRFRLLGGLYAQRGTQDIARFKTSKTGICLASCAFHLGKAIPREELIDQLWPDVDFDHGRQNLRQALSSLRRQLEPPDVSAGSIIWANHHHIQLNPAAVTTDVAEYQAAIKAAEQSNDLPQKIEYLTHAINLYGGELLPGFYADWILIERERLAATYVLLLRGLVAGLRCQGEPERAVEYALRAVSVEPLREELYQDLMELYAETGRPHQALQAYKRMKALLKRELGVVPSEATEQLARQLKKGQPVFVAEVAPGKYRANRSDDARPESEVTPTVIPYRHTRFFGRDLELETLVAWLDPSGEASSDRRMVTLTGLGGAGKTRLAIEAARRLEAQGKRVHFVPLADVTEPTRLADRVATALRLPPAPMAPTIERIVAALAGAPALLVLDNMEHLAEAGAELCNALLSLLPNLTLLVTSRQRIDIEAERVLPVPPLEVPRRRNAPVDMVQFPCVQLLLDRARAVCPDFQVTHRNAAALAALCARLEGIPLAIELAAAHASTLTPAQMLVQMADRFGFLVSQRRGVETRHRTMRACLEWSVALLSPPARRALAAVTVFRGGWFLEAAIPICGNSRILAEIEELCRHSLVIADVTEGNVRYRLLDVVREFAAETPYDDMLEIESRHADYYLALAEEAVPLLKGPQTGAQQAVLELEHDNFRAILTSDHSSHDVRLRLSIALWRFWVLRGYVQEGCERLEAVLAEPASLEHPARARALAGLGILLPRLARYDRARACLEESLAIHRSGGDRAGVAEALTGLGIIAENQGEHDQAGRLHAEALSIRRTLGDAIDIAGSLNNLGAISQALGDLEQANEYFSESAAIARTLGHTHHLAIVLNNLASVTFRQGHYARARGQYAECVALFETLGNNWAVAVAQNNLGEAYFREGNAAAASRVLKLSLQGYRELGDRMKIAHCLESLANAISMGGDAIRAVRLLEAGRMQRHELGIAVSPTGRQQAEEDALRIRSGVTEAELAAARTWATASTLDAILDYACENIDIQQNIP
jgi:predicted ATPase/DNA-binding SARP family transcriptional activator/Tfp pilus assembly protein PilF